MEATKTVLIAGVHGSVDLLAAAGKTAGVRAISGAILQLRDVAQSYGGSLVKETGDEVTVLFDSPHAAAAAAARIHAAVDALAPVAGVKLASQIGIHTGPVVERSGDVLGDTVNLALKLVRAAQRGQTITTQQTAALLTPAPAGGRMYLVPIGTQGGVRLYEVTSQLHGGLQAGRPVLLLRYGNAAVRCEPGNARLAIGRDTTCALVVRDPFASRRHCTLELGAGGFDLHDHSSNGTYVTNGTAREAIVYRARVSLAAHGWITLGQPRKLTQHAIEFFGH
jgi:hypothetical protein